MLTYSQSTGELRVFDLVASPETAGGDGERLGVGFSGNGVMRNKPAMESHSLEGPIPADDYTIGHFFLWRTGWQARLLPSGENFRHQKYYLKAGDVSRGCVCVPVEIVDRVRALVEQGERVLRVTR